MYTAVCSYGSLHYRIILVASSLIAVRSTAIFVIVYCHTMYYLSLVLLACLERTLSSSSQPSNISRSVTLGLGFSHSLTILSVLVVLCSSCLNLVFTLSRGFLHGGIERRKATLGNGGGVADGGERVARRDRNKECEEKKFKKKGGPQP